jgi:hypothetical protein
MGIERVLIQQEEPSELQILGLGGSLKQFFDIHLLTMFSYPDLIPGQIGAQSVLHYLKLRLGAPPASEYFFKKSHDTSSGHAPPVQDGHGTAKSN